MRHRERFLALQSVLQAHEALWRPQPFHVRRPRWCDEHPELADAVLALDDATVERFVADPDACRAWLAPRLPAVEILASLCRFDPLPARTLPNCDARFDWSIPGRKREQIEAFVAQGPAAGAPVLEWCAGKGHLGRRFALADAVPVTSLEIDPRLCEAAAGLAARSGVGQAVVCADALDESSQAHVRGRTVVALHACGELHRSLVRGAAHAGAHGYRIAPCCYHLGVGDRYRAVSRDASLALDADSLRLAVTETVTAPRHDRERLVRDQAWKLGFIALRNMLEGEAIRTFRPVPGEWLSRDFAAYCRALAQREHVPLPETIDWAHWQAAGEQRRREVRRLELVRHAFRRALEAWLVLDIALGLEEAGFAVRTTTFCPRALTPRNFLILAERAHPRPAR